MKMPFPCWKWARWWQDNYSFVRAMVRHSLLTLYVDLRSGKYRVFSRGELRIFGSITDGTYSDFLTRYLQKIVLPRDWEKFKFQLSLPEMIHALVMQEGRFECEMRVLLQNRYRWARFQFIKLDDKNVIPRTMVIVITDVQERHNRTDQMESAPKDAYQTAMEANKAKSVFLSSMSHDIRTPMNGIMGMTKIALQHLDDPARLEDCLKKIETSSEYLMRLLNEVLDMSREDNSLTNVQQGTGLGLSIAKAMVTKMGGTIEADSVQGRGTTVTVTLPLMPADNTAAPTPEEKEELRFDGHRILLVEDNELNREIALELLEQRGLTVETAVDGIDAVERFKAKPEGYYELVLMDIQMPRLIGYGAIKA